MTAGAAGFREALGLAGDAGLAEVVEDACADGYQSKLDRRSRAGRKDCNWTKDIDSSSGKEKRPVKCSKDVIQSRIRCICRWDTHSHSTSHRAIRPCPQRTSSEAELIPFRSGAEYGTDIRQFRCYRLRSRCQHSCCLDNTTPIKSLILGETDIMQFDNH